MDDDLRSDDFDALDDELRRRFGAGASTGADPDTVLDAMRPRLQHARTRRRASIAGALGGMAALVVVLAIALGGSGGGGGSVRTPPASGGPIHTFPTAPTTAPTGGAVTPDTVVKESGSNGGGVVNDDEPATSSPPETAPSAGGGGDTGGGATATTVAPAPPAQTEYPYDSPGGSIVVHFDGSQVSLVSSSPAAGYTAAVHDNGPTRVEVRFSNGQTEWRIRVDVQDGTLVSEISPH